MNRYFLAVVVTFSMLFGLGSATVQENVAKITIAAEDFAQNGISATLAAGYKKLNLQLSGRVGAAVTMAAHYPFPAYDRS